MISVPIFTAAYCLHSSFYQMKLSYGDNAIKRKQYGVSKSLIRWSMSFRLVSVPRRCSRTEKVFSDSGCVTSTGDGF